MSDGLIEEQTYYGPGVATGLTSGSVVFIGVNGEFSEDSGLFYDAANQRLGVGTNAGTYSFEVSDDWEFLLGLGNRSANGTSAIELGIYETGDRISYFDFHAANGADYNLRVIRFAGVNGAAYLQQVGTGAFALLREGSSQPIQQGLNGTLLDLPGVLSRATTTGSVGNTTTETSIYSYTVPAGIMQTNRTLRLTLGGSYQNNSGSNQTVIFRVKWNGTKYADTTVAIPTSATFRAYNIVITFNNVNGVANDNRIFGMFALAPSGAATTGTGDLATAAPQVIQPFASGAIAVDTSVDQTVSVTIENSAAGSVTWFYDTALLELL